MGQKLAELWALLKLLPEGDTRRLDIQRKINNIEEYCIQKGYAGFKITRWNDNEFNISPNYPDKVGAVFYDDLKIGDFRALLLSVVNADRKVILKFYEPITKRVILWKDPTEYKPYCYMTLEDGAKAREFMGVESVEIVEKKNVITDSKEQVAQVICRDNSVINKLAETYKTWESDIKIQNSYLYDNNFQVGKWYELHKDYVKILTNDSKIDLGTINVDGIIEKEKFLNSVEGWAKLLDEEIPHIKRLAFDIEVETSNSFPDPMVAAQRVTAISFVGDDTRKCFVLKREGVEYHEKSNCQLGGTCGEILPPIIPDSIKNKYEVVFYDSEKKMLEDSFDIIESYPVVLSYNGDTFDMPYLYNRAVILGIANIPFKMMKQNATLSTGIHIDLYPVFKNRSLKIYAFKSKYVENGLNSVSKALLGEGKTEGVTGDHAGELPLYTLAAYCFNDSSLTYKLSSYNDNLVMNLLVIISRISNSSIDEASRYAVSNWIKSLLYYTHRINGELIPKSTDFPQKEASTKSVGDKKYEGAIVLEPVSGVHFDVKVMDFASLYPSIIKVNNVSYETVNCSHAECEVNKVPFTSHWICTKKTGIVSSVIGSLKELRVGHFKKLSKTAKTEDEKSRYETISEALKVFLNASYGVIGYETFPLYYLPTAEAVTAYGRNTITETVNTAKDFEMNVIYGDTDSIFLKSPTKNQIDNLIAYAKQAFNIDLEQDKTYRYVVLSNRRKNYFGIKSDGTTDIKGLTGKKSSTPPFIRTLFNSIMERLKQVQTLDDFEVAKDWIRTTTQRCVEGFESIPIEQLSFKVLVKDDPSSYKVKTAAIKAGELLGTVKKGDYIEYVKIRGTRAGIKVKPVQLVQRKEIDKDKYMEILETTMSQIVEPMELDIDELMGKGKQMKLGAYW